ncbi:hypothetical protein KVP09_12855 [Alcaligenaceae bacterium CGII-47]|nr:hypothetical protein [Alcaligenaceae bacterium CGII-47]
MLILIIAIVFRRTAFVNEYVMLGRVVRASTRKILVFLSVVLSIAFSWGRQTR